jgi:hypothetical protein
MNSEHPDLPNECGEINCQGLSPFVICRSAIGTSIWAGDGINSPCHGKHTGDIIINNSESVLKDAENALKSIKEMELKIQN